MATDGLERVDKHRRGWKGLKWAKVADGFCHMETMEKIKRGGGGVKGGSNPLQ